MLWPGLTAAVEFAAPRPGACWVLTKIAVHYRVGIKHFTATGAVEVAACATKNPALANTAMNAADGNGNG